MKNRKKIQISLSDTFFTRFQFSPFVTSGPSKCKYDVRYKSSFKKLQTIIVVNDVADRGYQINSILITFLRKMTLRNNLYFKLLPEIAKNTQMQLNFFLWKNFIYYFFACIMFNSVQNITSTLLLSKLWDLFLKIQAP